MIKPHKQLTPDVYGQCELQEEKESTECETEFHQVGTA